MTEKSASDIVREFVDYANAGERELVDSLVVEDIKFTDIAGDVYIEKEFMSSYLKAYPNYKIDIQQMFRGGSGVAFSGKTRGSHVPAEIEFEETLIWTAEVRDGLISEWRIYLDEDHA